MDELTIAEITREEYEQDRKYELMVETYEARMIAEGYEKCEQCNEWVESLYSGLCDDCIYDILKDADFETALEYAIHNDQEYEFLTEHIFTKEEVIDILKKEAQNALILDKSMFDAGIFDYLNEDETHYIDYLKKKGDI